MKRRIYPRSVLADWEISQDSVAVPEAIPLATGRLLMPVTYLRHKKKFGVYHWDTFDNETFLVGEADTLHEAQEIVDDKYYDRINAEHGADQVDIVNDEGEIVQKFKVC